MSKKIWFLFLGIIIIFLASFGESYLGSDLLVKSRSTPEEKLSSEVLDESDKLEKLIFMYDVSFIKTLVGGLFIELVPDSIAGTENEDHKTIYIGRETKYLTWILKIDQ